MAAALVAPGDELEEQVRGVGLEGQVAELVDDQQLGLGVEAPAARRAAPRHAPWRAGARAPAPARTAPSSRPRWPRGRARRPDASCRRPGGPSSSSASPLAMQRPVASSRIWPLSSEGWAAKSKPARSRTNGKWAIPMRHLDAPLVLAGDLALAEQRQRLAQGQLAPARLVQQAVELVADRGQLEPGRAWRPDDRGGSPSAASPDQLPRTRPAAAAAPAARARRESAMTRPRPRRPRRRSAPARPAAGAGPPARHGPRPPRRHGGCARARRATITRTVSPISRQGTL